MRAYNYFNRYHLLHMEIKGLEGVSLRYLKQRESKHWQKKNVGKGIVSFFFMPAGPASHLEN